ncbi:MAG: hypothetical protein L0215_13680 [Gemmataceae bacterium]|nr:hypothetical protein [Gemmataceae bacterium]
MKQSFSPPPDQKRDCENLKRTSLSLRRLTFHAVFALLSLLTTNSQLHAQGHIADVKCDCTVVQNDPVKGNYVIPKGEFTLYGIGGTTVMLDAIYVTLHRYDNGKWTQIAGTVQGDNWRKDLVGPSTQQRSRRLSLPDRSNDGVHLPGSRRPAASQKGESTLLLAGICILKLSHLSTAENDKARHSTEDW